ncbi:putative nuclease HARBI1 [Heterodontus francisci]|uniref:putative nuclease HARBI1 n=1 Tax=Heterodontus francisci TaxID=7792 RepID=UPI00355AF74C
MAVKVTTAISCSASSVFQGSAVDICRISQSAAHKCISQVTNAMFAKAATYLHFATDEASQIRRPLGLATVTGFPQLICDHQNIFMHVCARYPGSCHDYFILQQSLLPQSEWVAPWRQGYTLRPWLMTPLRSPTTDEEDWSHMSTRAIIEHTIGLQRCVSGAWTILGALKYSPTSVLRMVILCCDLHSIMLQKGLELQEEEGADRLSSSEEEEEKKRRTRSLI